jgi:excisionase family DNA binding protein
MNMKRTKSEIMAEIIALISQLANDEEETALVEKKSSENTPVEMLTIKECTSVIRGLSEHTVRQLIAQGKLPSIRTGQGVRGKILVNKADLLAYFTGV